MTATILDTSGGAPGQLLTECLRAATAAPSVHNTQPWLFRPRGTIISVAGNEIPAEMSRMVELAEQGDFAGARALHKRLLPLLMVNFIESNPIPVKSAMASMGLLDEVYRLPMVSPREESRKRIEQVLIDLQLAAVEARHA